MHIKIFFQDKPLFLCNEINAEIAPYIQHDDTIFMDEFDAPSIKTIIFEMQQPKVHAGVFLHSNLDELKKAIWKKFTIIQAAGGVIKNEQDEILMIFRKGKWDLPKGKLDEGENLETCAIREVGEETGLSEVKLLSPLIITYHTYHEGTKFILKESHWYRMKAKENQSLAPQTEEGTTEIKWVDDSLVHKYLPLSYPLITDIIKAERNQA
jgi:8-oxo-dGTP pyrophosphatase MutT (NUDIX family)